MVELRRYTRAPLDTPVEFSRKGKPERLAGRAKDISLGGMFIETASPLAFHDELLVHIVFPDGSGPFALPGVVRWTRPGGMGIQFGLVGARETYAITEFTKEGALVEAEQEG